MITINLTITIDETKLDDIYTTDQIVQNVKDEILSMLNYDEPDVAQITFTDTHPIRLQSN